MPKIDYSHDGTEHEYEATTYTLMVYEQEFKSDLIKDVFGRIDIERTQDNLDEDGNVRYIDYTTENWLSYPKALWAMLKTSEAIARSEGRRVETVPSFSAWALKASDLNLHELMVDVITECNRGLFHSGAADSE